MYYQKSWCHPGSGKNYQGGCHSKHQFAGSFWAGMSAAGGMGAVNIAENANGFEIHVFAPGYQKDHFTLEVSGNVLTISLKHAETETANEQKWVRREFKASGFERRFELGDSIDAANISARYTDGVLVVTLPKKVADTPAQSVKID